MAGPGDQKDPATMVISELTVQARSQMQRVGSRADPGGGPPEGKWAGSWGKADPVPSLLAAWQVTAPLLSSLNETEADGPRRLQSQAVSKCPCHLCVANLHKICTYLHNLGSSQCSSWAVQLTVIL